MWCTVVSGTPALVETTCRVSLIPSTLSENMTDATPRRSVVVWVKLTFSADPFTVGCFVMIITRLGRRFRAMLLTLWKFAGMLAPRLLPRSPLSRLSVLRIIGLTVLQLRPMCLASTLQILVRVRPIMLLVREFLVEQLSRVTPALVVTMPCNTVCRRMTLVQHAVPVVAGMNVMSARRQLVLFIPLRPLLPTSRPVMTIILMPREPENRLTTVLHTARRPGRQKLAMLTTRSILLTVLPSSSTLLSIVTLVLLLRGGMWLNMVLCFGDFVLFRIHELFDRGCGFF